MRAKSITPQPPQENTLHVHRHHKAHRLNNLECEGKAEKKEIKQREEDRS